MYKQFQIEHTFNTVGGNLRECMFQPKKATLTAVLLMIKQNIFRYGTPGQDKDSNLYILNHVYWMMMAIAEELPNTLVARYD